MSVSWCENTDYQGNRCKNRATIIVSRTIKRLNGWFKRKNGERTTPRYKTEMVRMIICNSCKYDDDKLIANIPNEVVAPRKSRAKVNIKDNDLGYFKD
jgi:hypothetical protein